MTINLDGKMINYETSDIEDHLEETLRQRGMSLGVPQLDDFRCSWGGPYVGREAKKRDIQIIYDRWFLGDDKYINKPKNEGKPLEEVARDFNDPFKYREVIHFGKDKSSQCSLFFDSCGTFNQIDLDVNGESSILPLIQYLGEHLKFDVSNIDVNVNEEDRISEENWKKYTDKVRSSTSRTELGKFMTSKVDEFFDRESQERVNALDRCSNILEERLIEKGYSAQEIIDVVSIYFLDNE